MPAASLVRAASWVVAFAGTATVIPAPANCAGVPVAAGEPEHEAFVYSFTAVGRPGAGRALDLGVVVARGGFGSVSVICGGGRGP